MRKGITLISLLLIFCLLSQVSFAHSPKRIDIKFVGNKIKIRVYHHVGNTKMHYVKYINIYINGKWVAKQRFFSQEYDDYQEAIFNVPDLKAKDVLLVIAHCNRKGRIDKSVIAPN